MRLILAGSVPVTAARQPPRAAWQPLAAPVPITVAALTAMVSAAAESSSQLVLGRVRSLVHSP